MVSEEDVKAAYRLILGREPESEDVVKLLSARFSNIMEMRSAFLRSEEFLTSRSIDGPLYLACVPARYAQNMARYASRGGLIRDDDARGFLAKSPGGDLARYYFLCMVIDQLVKEDIQGDFAELGVYQGATASLLAALARRSGRSTYLLDTFEGFVKQDLVGIDAHKPPEFSDTSMENVAELVGKERVHFIKGYFPESGIKIPAKARFSLVHIDCDLYAPFKSALEYFWERLSPGGFLVMHDYASLHWDGAEKAVDEFFANRAEGIVLIPDTSGTAVARKAGR